MKVGLDAALKQVRFSEEKYRARGGVYDWLRDRPAAEWFSGDRMPSATAA